MKEINVAYESLIDQKNTPKKEIETASSSGSMDFGSMDFDDILSDLLENGSRNLELRNLRNTVKNLLNKLIDENNNYKAIETEKGIISAEQIKTSLQQIIQTIFAEKKLDKEFLKSLENNFSGNLATKTKNPNQFANILVYCLQEHYNYVGQAYEHKINASAMDIIIKVAEFNFPTLPQGWQDNKSVIIDKGRLRKLQTVHAK